MTIRNLLKEDKNNIVIEISPYCFNSHLHINNMYTEAGFYNQDYLCSFLDFSMREFDGLKVWDGFGFIGFTFKIADSESSVLREALKSVLLFLTVLMTRTANKVHIRVYLQYPTFNWVSSTHIHRGIIYRKSHTLIPWNKK